MKNISLLSLFVLLSMLLAACGSSPTQPKQRFVPYTEESAILGLTNAFRAQAQTCGTQQFPAAPALTWVEAVGDVAWFHSLDMAGADTENHVGATAVERMRARGFDAGIAAENRKKTALPGNPQEAFNLWTADPEACANIMDPSFTNMGAGYAGHHDGITTGAYWTQLLTAPRGNTPAPSLTLNPTTATATIGGGAIAFTATLTNSVETINWTLTGPGSISNATGATTNYTAPATGDAGTATLTVTAGALTQTATITINAAAPVPTLTVTPTIAAVNVGGAAIQFTAMLTNSTDVLTWSMTGAGTFSWAGSTFTYIPPATGGNGTATITVTAGALTASATVTVTAVAPPAPDLQQFLTLINDFRSQQQTCFNGDVQETMPAVPPVTFDTLLNQAARLHSEDMAANNYFDHTGLNGSTFSQRILATGYTGTPQGENIAAGNDTVQGAFDSWRESRGGHCQGMMSANANEIGLGYGFNATSQWTHYWTLVFARK